MTTFYLFVRDALLIMMGTDPSPLPHLRVCSETDLSTRKGRTEYQRGILKMNDQGKWVVRTTGPQSSAILRSMTEANCMIYIPGDVERVSAGDMVDVVLFEGFV